MRPGKAAERVKGHPDRSPRGLQSGPSRKSQVERLGEKFDRIEKGLDLTLTSTKLASQPDAIVPGRGLIFETAVPVSSFIAAAIRVGLEVQSEFASPAPYPKDLFQPKVGADVATMTLYATLPSETSLRAVTNLWKKYKIGAKPDRGETAWWDLFDSLVEVRAWGPKDRLDREARRVIAARLPCEPDDRVRLEIEIWPTSNETLRKKWKTEILDTVEDLDGLVVDESSIHQHGLSYEALLIELSSHQVRVLLEKPGLEYGLPTLEGIQFILPQTIAQSAPLEETIHSERPISYNNFDPASPYRIILMDGVPVAGHSALDGGVEIEDPNDIVSRSLVSMRRHGTAMASLIARGDLVQDGEALKNSRILAVPVLVDSANGTSSRPDRLFIDVLHRSLLHCFAGSDPVAPEAFVINLSLGIEDLRFSGKVSALARLLDWWAWRYGLLFVVSAGNIVDQVVVENIRSSDFEDLDPALRQKKLREALHSQSLWRTLLSPAEAINVLTVGAVSGDLNPKALPRVSSVISWEADNELLPQITSACGLGPDKSLKPDILAEGGKQELRIKPNGAHTTITSAQSQRTGLVVASPGGDLNATGRCVGTSPATALTSRRILAAYDALVGEDGPYAETSLERPFSSLLCRALAVNSALWPPEHSKFLEDELRRTGASSPSTNTKRQVSRSFGYGVLEPSRMLDCPANGATLVAHGVINKDTSRIFELPLPPSMSGRACPRQLRVTVAWFCPVTTHRTVYRTAVLGATCRSHDTEVVDKEWKVKMKGWGPDLNMAGKGSVWSWRLTSKTQKIPQLDARPVIPICISCREAWPGALAPEDDVPFAVAVSFELEEQVSFDVYQEIQSQLRVRVSGST